MPPRRLPRATEKLSRDASAEERARAAIAKAEAAPGQGDRVRLVLRVVLKRQDAGALSARAIREERNLEAAVQEILAEAVRSRK
jgi:hypothetical protein